MSSQISFKDNKN